MKKRMLSILLILCMVASLLPTTAFAADVTVNNLDELNAAITNASSDTQIILADGYTGTGTVTVAAGKTITLNLNGKTLDGGAAIAIDNAGTLTIDNKFTTKTGSVTGSGDKTINNTGTLNVKSDTITSITNAAAGAVWVLDGMIGSIDNTAGGILMVGGGSIKTITGTAKYNETTPLSLYTLTIPGKANTEVSSIYLSAGGYFYGQGTDNGIKTDGEGKLYFWLPTGRTYKPAISFGQQKYVGTTDTTGATLQLSTSTPAELNIAIAAATENAIIQLADDYTGTGTVTVGAGQTITLDLNGKTLDGSTAAAISNAGTLSITDSSTKKEGAVTGSGGKTINNTGTLTASVNKIENTAAGNAILSSGTGALTVTHGMITSSTGTAIKNTSSGAFKVTGGSINSIVGSPKASDGTTALQLYTLMIDGVSTPVAIKSLTFDPAYENYDITGIKTDAAGKLYIWAPAGRTMASVTVGTAQYSGNISSNAATLVKQDRTITVGKTGTEGADYSSLYSALAAANRGDTIKLLSGLVQNDTTIDAGKSITIDLNGFTLDIGITNSGTLTVTDGSPAQTGWLTKPNGTDITNKGTLHISGGTLGDQWENVAPAIINDAGATMTVHGGTVDGGNENTIANSGTATINGGIIKNQAAALAAIDNKSGGTLTINGGTVKINPTTANTKAAIENSGTLNIAGGSIESITGGGAYTQYTMTLWGLPGDKEVTGLTLTPTVTYGMTGIVTDDNKSGDGNIYVWLPSSAGALTSATATVDGKSYSGTFSGAAATLKRAPETVTVGAVGTPGATYNTVAAALAAIGKGDTIQLLSDIDEAVTISNTQDCTLDLNGHTLAKTDSTTSVVSNAGTLTITDSSLAQTGKVVGAVTSSSSGAVSSNGTLTVLGGKLSNSSAGSAVYVRSGTATISGGEITNTGTGNAVSASDAGTATISGGAMTSKSLSGTVYASGTLTISGGEITNTGTGNAVKYTGSGKLLTISGGTLTAAGATPALLDSSTLTKIDGGSIKNAVNGMSQALTPKNAAGADLKMYTLTLSGVAKGTQVNGITLNPAYTYGMNGVKTDEGGKLYVWLPATTAATTTVTATIGTEENAKLYDGTLTTTAETLKQRKEAGPGAPTVTFSFSGTDAGKIMGTSGLMEYSLDGGTVWADCTASATTLSAAALESITAANGIQVRVKETATVNAGTAAAIAITAGGAVTGVTAGDDLKLKGVTTAMEYKLSTDTTWTAGTGADITGASSAEYSVRVKAAGTVQYGAASTYTLPMTITAAAIPGVTAPAKGGTPVSRVASDVQYTGTVTWSGSPVTFAADTVYTATITLTPITGATLTGVAENFFTVAGATTVTNDADSGVITAVFPKTAAKTLTSIAVTAQPTNKTYTYGESFDPAGMVVTATYDDGTTAAVTGYTVDPQKLTVATTSLTVTLDGKTATVSGITVAPKEITLSGVTAENKAYNGTATAIPSGTAALNGAIANDDVTVTPGTAAFADKDVGTGKTVTFIGYGLSGTDAANYTLSAQPANVTANITAAPITVTGPDTGAVTKVYDGTTNAGAFTGALVFSGKVGSENVSVIATPGAYADANVGTGKTVTLTLALDGTDKGNYTLASPTYEFNAAAITKADAPTSVAASENVMYNDAAQKTHTPTGLPSDMGTVSYTLGAVVDTNSILAAGTAVNATSGVISYTLASAADTNKDKTVTIPVTVSSQNYKDFTYTLTVTVIDKTQVTITGGTVTDKTYDGTPMVPGGTVVVKNGDAVLTATDYGTLAYTYTSTDGGGYSSTTAPTAAGAYKLVISVAADHATYTGQQEITFAIDKATITITAKDKSAYVGDTAPVLGAVLGTDYTVSGLAAGETLGGTIALAYASEPVMTATGTTTINISGAVEPVGSNYNAISYVPGTLTISNRPSGGGDGGSATPPPVTEIKTGGSSTGDNLDRLISEKKELTVIGGSGAKVVFGTEALKGIDNQTSGGIQVEVKDVSKDYQTTHEGKTVFTLTVTSGSKTISSFGGSVRVSLPYALKDGESAENVTVWYLAQDGSLTEIPCTYDAKTGLATFTVTHFSEYVVGVDTNWVNPFTDVAEKNWFYAAVKFAHQNNLFSGTSATTFAPDVPMTRAMLWTVLGRLDGQTLSGSADVFDAAKTWATQKGITDGTNPGGDITREQLITILWRYVGSPTASGDLAAFTDHESVAGYAKDAMAWAVENGIVGGSNGKLMPTGNATRAQVAAILMRYCQTVTK